MKDKTEGVGKINFLLGCVGKLAKIKLDMASKNCSKTQEKTLRSILNYAKDTEWGKKHNFTQILQSKTAKELFENWQKNVPVSDYEDLRPYVERHKHGEENLLFPGKPKMYATTSGTTKEPKWIPITNEYFNKVYSKMTHLWLYSFMMHRPKVFEGRCVSIVSKAVEGYAPDGTVYGSVSGVTQRECPEFMKKLYSAPADVFAIEDYKARYYTIMRFGLEQNVALLVVCNPSTVIELENNVNLYFEDFVNDIEKGTLSTNMKISPEIRKSLEPYFKSNPERAKELRALKEKYGTIYPKHYWPDLQVLTTWKCGNTKVYMDKYDGTFPEKMLYQEFGYFASECRTGLVMNGKDDTVLFPHMHYFEFIRQEDLDNPNPEFLQLNELEPGKRYSIYVTTWAGLYRYCMNDLVECTGFYNSIPEIQFIQKINGIISMTGEKLHERQFMTAVKEAEAETSFKTKFFVGFANVQKSLYHMYFEFENQGFSQKEADIFAKAVDEKLKEINCEYEEKRASSRIKNPVAHLLVKDAFEKFKVTCINNGARDGQFKLNLLMQDEKRQAIFNDLIKL